MSNQSNKGIPAGLWESSEKRHWLHGSKIMVPSLNAGMKEDEGEKFRYASQIFLQVIPGSSFAPWSLVWLVGGP